MEQQSTPASAGEATRSHPGAARICSTGQLRALADCRYIVLDNVLTSAKAASLASEFASIRDTFRGPRLVPVRPVYSQ